MLYSIVSCSLLLLPCRSLNSRTLSLFPSHSLSLSGCFSALFFHPFLLPPPPSATFDGLFNVRLSDGLIVKEQLSHRISPLSSCHVRFVLERGRLSTGKGWRSLQYLSVHQWIAHTMRSSITQNSLDWGRWQNMRHNPFILYIINVLMNPRGILSLQLIFYLTYQQACGESDITIKEEKWFISPCLIINPL